MNKASIHHRHLTSSLEGLERIHLRELLRQGGGLIRTTFLWNGLYGGARLHAGQELLDLILDAVLLPQHSSLLEVPADLEQHDGEEGVDDFERRSLVEVESSERGHLLSYSFDSLDVSEVDSVQVDMRLHVERERVHGHGQVMVLAPLRNEVVLQKVVSKVSIDDLAALASESVVKETLSLLELPLLQVLEELDSLHVVLHHACSLETLSHSLSEVGHLVLEVVASHDLDIGELANVESELKRVDH